MIYGRPISTTHTASVGSEDITDSGETTQGLSTSHIFVNFTGGEAA
jgi:hypothetical protein